METLRNITTQQSQNAREAYGTPLYLYSADALETQARRTLAFPNAFGLTVRYAMKASPNAAILKRFTSLGLHIDASSGWEVRRALKAGVPAGNISLSTQQMPEDFGELHAAGIRFNACSLAQLKRFGQLFPGQLCGVRFNPGLGSGGTGKTNVGGPHSSFGIWHEWADEVEAIAQANNLTIERIHTHIGSGSDPAVWERVSHLSLALVRRFTDVKTLNLGGGFKVGRMDFEKSTDLQVVGEPVKEAFVALAEETGRKIHLEIEPGTFLLANACSLLTTVQDIVATGGLDGRQFLKLDGGMTEILRPSLYAAQHPIIISPNEPTEGTADYLVVGHCCESGDVLTVGADDPESLQPRTLTKAAIGDLCVIEGAGAYCSSMSAKNYNSFPEAAEALLEKDGTLRLIRRRQTLEQILQNEVDEV
ncbi:diaminopimelate decarboxylase [Cerasicoccus arenae]|uniref:Diaminopimelate decarboxylase n=1 Tax=Cerasicoccus arenae TaxID=424488 RepID=A0A8J3GD64_9BACT|nr:diaminopimelate decarboxylase [Cerasicoccus arenae]MBK1858819.1 diaminopimelate decarboxylase [Cerasicoccus arenae]GHC04417.1 diaminopimelate decarboxylase [Cerasicoccus arenae]